MSNQVFIIKPWKSKSPTATASIIGR
jgi:hypothetical protein